MAPARPEDDATKGKSGQDPADLRRPEMLMRCSAVERGRGMRTDYPGGNAGLLSRSLELPPHLVLVLSIPRKWKGALYADRLNQGSQSCEGGE